MKYTVIVRSVPMLPWAKFATPVALKMRTIAKPSNPYKSPTAMPLTIEDIKRLIVIVPPHID
jgi:hypothetical protein